MDIKNYKVKRITRGHVNWSDKDAADVLPELEKLIEHFYVEKIEIILDNPEAKLVVERK